MHLNGTATILKESLKKYRSMGGDYDYGLMAELKRSGAPILGVFDMKPDNGYEWELRVENDNLVYSWKYVEPLTPPF